MQDKELREDDIEALYYLLFSAKQYENPYWSKVATQMVNSKINSNSIIDLLKEINLNFFIKKASLSQESLTNSNTENYIFLFLATNLHEMNPKYLFNFKG